MSARGKGSKLANEKVISKLQTLVQISGKKKQYLMAYELHSVLSGSVNEATGELVRPAYGGEPDSFINKVVTPIYWVIYKEAEKNKKGTADHSEWRNYDDLNEFFWSPDCFQLGWRLRLDHNFFFVPSISDHQDSKEKKMPRRNPQPKTETSDVAATPPVRDSSPLIWKEKVEDTLQEQKNARETQKMQLQAKSEEKAEVELKQMRQNLGFKAKPMPDFYREPQSQKTPVKQAMTKTSRTRTPIPTHSAMSTPRRSVARENASPNIQR